MSLPNEKTDYKLKPINFVHRCLSYSTHDSATLNYTVSISIGQRPLAARPTRNAVIVESLLITLNS